MKMTRAEMKKTLEADLKNALEVDRILIKRIRQGGRDNDKAKMGEVVFAAINTLTVEQLAVLGRQSIHDRAGEIIEALDDYETWPD